MTDSSRPTPKPADDDVEGHVVPGAARVEPPRDENDADVMGHSFSVRPETRDPDDDVEGHVYVRPEDQSRES